VQAPGRFGPNHARRSFTRLGPLVDEIAQIIQPYLNKPFALFGHSMGAIIAFELADILRTRHDLETLHLFVSGHRAPQLPNPDPPTYDLPEPEFLKELERLKGTPSEVLQNPELMELMLPQIREDFEIVQTYAYSQRAPCGVPITAFGGLHDEHVTSEAIEAWGEQTTVPFSFKMLPGDHFFLDAVRPYLLNLISQDISQYLQPYRESRAGS
jgi:medium-chain acyl-[acyl-carrier-protein] hydrolase